jgi:hypothetical protein
MRIVVDRAPALVSIGETWPRTACGPFHVDDPIPSEHLGLESLGAALSVPGYCYGVALTIVTDTIKGRSNRQHATKRAILQCKRK